MHVFFWESSGDSAHRTFLKGSGSFSRPSFLPPCSKPLLSMYLSSSRYKVWLPLVQVLCRVNRQWFRMWCFNTDYFGLVVDIFDQQTISRFRLICTFSLLLQPIKRIKNLHCTVCWQTIYFCCRVNEDDSFKIRIVSAQETCKCENHTRQKSVG